MSSNAAVYYHDDMDGFASAFAFYLYKEKDFDKVFYEPINHGDVMPIDKVDKLIFLDFCPPEEDVKTYIKNGFNLIIIDHHASKKDIYDKYRDKCEFVYDIKHAGCELTRQHFTSNSQYQQLFKYIEDRDLWKFKYPETKPVHAALLCLPKDFKLWAKQFQIHDGLVKIYLKGRNILEYQDYLVKEIAKNAIITDWPFEPHNKNYTILSVNTSILASEVCDYLLFEDERKVDFVAAFNFEYKKMRWQLRSRDDFDVSEIAKINDGGGHRNAAGFVIDYNED